eukprot:1593219-Amphidinium_carterae.3
MCLSSGKVKRWKGDALAACEVFVSGFNDKVRCTVKQLEAASRFFSFGLRFDDRRTAHPNSLFVEASFATACDHPSHGETGVATFLLLPGLKEAILAVFGEGEGRKSNKDGGSRTDAETRMTFALSAKNNTVLGDCAAPFRGQINTAS